MLPLFRLHSVARTTEDEAQDTERERALKGAGKTVQMAVNAVWGGFQPSHRGAERGSGAPVPGAAFSLAEMAQIYPSKDGRRQGTAEGHLYATGEYSARARQQPAAFQAPKGGGVGLPRL